MTLILNGSSRVKNNIFVKIMLPAKKVRDNKLIFIVKRINIFWLDVCFLLQRLSRVQEGIPSQGPEEIHLRKKIQKKLHPHNIQEKDI